MQKTAQEWRDNMRNVKYAGIQMQCSRSVEENIAKADKMVREAAANGAKIILLPELFERQYFCQERNYDYYAFATPADENPAVKHFQKVAAELQVVLPISFYERDINVFYNTVAVIDADGSVLGIYRKTHIPDDHYYQEKFYFTPGDTGFKVWDTRYARIGVGICWDQWFPETARGMSVQGAEILFYPTAIGSEPILEVDSMPHWRRCMQGLDDIYAEYENLKKIYGTDYEQMTKEMKLWYKNLPDGHPAKDHSHYNRVDGKGVYFPDNISWPGGGGPKYEVLHPVTHKPVKVPSRGWLTNEKTMKEWIEQGRVEFGKDENGVPTLKSYLKDREYTVPYSVFYKDGRAASKRLATLMGDKVFENPKDEEIIERLIEFCGVSDGDYILDFFSGSGTTAHASFLANIMQQKNRHFILVQIPEEISEKNATSEKSKKVVKSAINLCDNLGVAHTICEIGKERIRRAARKISEDHPYAVFDGGFRVFKCDSSNMKDIYYTPSETQQSLFDTYADNIKEDRTPEDLLFQVMLDLGVLLSSKIEETTIAGKQVFNVADGFLIACFDNDVTEETVKAVAEKKPYYAVFRDSSMANDSVATNFDQIFASISPETVRKVL